MPIADMKRYVDLAAQGEATRAERPALLESHRDLVRQRLAEVGQHLGIAPMLTQVRLLRDALAGPSCATGIAGALNAINKY